MTNVHSDHFVLELTLRIPAQNHLFVTKLHRLEIVVHFQFQSKAYDVDLQPLDSLIVRRPNYQRHFVQYEADDLSQLYFKISVTGWQVITRLFVPRSRCL